MLVYKGDFDLRTLAGVREILLARQSRNTGQLDELLLHARRAVALVPEAPAAHAELCVASLMIGFRPEVERECRAALALATKDPYFSAEELAGLKSIAEPVLMPSQSTHPSRNDPW